MQFTLIALDGTDSEAPARRLKVREAHLAMHNELAEKGNMFCGGAILDDAGNMIGSQITGQFETQAEFDEWLANDPYVTGNVWQDITVYPFRLAPRYQK